MVVREIASITDPLRKVNIKLAVIPVEQIRIPICQRSVSPSLVKELEVSFQEIGFIGGLTVVEKNGNFYVIDGMHRLAALKNLGVDSVLAFVLPEEYYEKILYFNTEKPPSIRERSVQAYTLYSEMPQDMKEVDLFKYIPEPHLVTIGLLITKINPKFPASIYENFLEKIEFYEDLPINKAVETRRKRAEKVNQLAEKLNEVTQKLFPNEDFFTKNKVHNVAIKKAFGSLRMVRGSSQEEFETYTRQLLETYESLTPTDFVETFD